MHLTILNIFLLAKMYLFICLFCSVPDWKRNRQHLNIISDHFSVISLVQDIQYLSVSYHIFLDLVKILAAVSVSVLSNHSASTCNHDLFLHYSRFQIVSNCLLLLFTEAQKLILTSTYKCFRSSTLQWSIIAVLSSADHFYSISPFSYSPLPFTLLLRRCRYVSSSV